MTGRGLKAADVTNRAYYPPPSGCLGFVLPLATSCKTLPVRPLSLLLKWKSDGFCPIRICLKPPTFPCLLSLTFSDT